MLFKQPSSRARDDEDDNAPIWSPAIKTALEDWYTAKHEHDDEGLKTAARDIINATAAYHRAGGVPLFAHRPLPPQLVDAELRGLGRLPQQHADRVIDAFVDKFDESAKPVVTQQIRAILKRGSGEGTIDVASLAEDSLTDGIYAKRAPDDIWAHPDGVSPIEFSQATDNRSTSWENAEASHNKNLRPNSITDHASNQPQPYPPIVRPYRSDDTPRPTGKDPELDEAKLIAQDADNWIRIVRQKVRDARFDRSSNGFLRQVAAAIERYYADGSDRSVAAVGSSDVDLNAGQTDDYAGFDPSTERIYFNKRFRTADKFEKIVTIIHEALHTIPYMKDLARASGYYQANRGSAIFAQYEAQLDNFAKALAKQLGLIPQNYPPTDWHALVSPKRR